MSVVCKCCSSSNVHAGVISEMAMRTYSIEQLHKQLHYVRLTGTCGKCPIATIQIISTFNYAAIADGQTANHYSVAIAYHKVLTYWKDDSINTI